MQTGLIELIPLTGTNQGEEHSERQPPAVEQNAGPPSETEVRSVEKGHEHVMRNADQLDFANAVMLMVERALEANDASGAWLCRRGTDLEGIGQCCRRQEPQRPGRGHTAAQAHPRVERLFPP
jgi:hypothetical protein